MRKKHQRARISKRFSSLLKAEERYETNFSYWTAHALHWQALLVAMIGILTVGYMFFR